MRLPLRSFATLLLAVGVATCSDAPTANTRPTPAGKSVGRVALAAVFSKAAQAVYSERGQFADVTFDHVRVVLVRPVADTVKDTTIVFTPGSPDVPLDLSVEVRASHEKFTATIDYTSGGASVFRGEAQVESHAPDETAAPQEIVVQYVGVGSNATRVVVAPKTVTLVAPASQTFNATAFDANGNAVAAPVSWTTSDASLATISGTGVLQPTGKRGTVTVTVTTLTHLSDNASATITLPASAIALVSGGGQTGKAGAALGAPGVVRVTAADGVGVAGVTVNFAAPTGGKVGSSSVTTDANGTASTSLTLGSAAGPQSFAAVAAGFSVSIPETATAGDPAVIAAISGGGQADTVRRGLKNPFVVKVTDQFGNPVASVTVSWTRTSGSGTLGGATSVTGTDGLTSIGYTLGTAVGTETISASVAGVASTASFTVQALPAGPAAIAAVSGGGQTGRAAQPLGAPFVVRVTDDAGNPVGNVGVAWSASNGTFGTATTITDAQGQSSNTLTLGGALGGASGTATVGIGTSAKSVTFTATVQPGIVARLVFRSPPPNAAAGAALAPPVQIELRDIAGNLTAAANGVTIALGANPGGATLTGTLTRTSANGVATFDDLKLDKAGTGYTLVASSAGAPSVTSAAFSIGAAAATTLTIAAGDNQTAVVNTAVAVAASVKALDANENPVAGVVVTFTPATGNGSVIPTTPITTNAQGIATLTSWTLGQTAGPQALVASAPGATNVTFHATAMAGAAFKLGIITQPSASATSGVALTQQPVLQVQDPFNNAVPTTSPIAVTATPSAGAVSGNVVSTSAGGVATFTNLVVTGSASLTLSFSASGLQSVTSTPIALGVGAPAVMAFVDGQTGAVLQSPSVTTVAGTAPTNPPAIKVSDGGGNGVPGVSVALTITQGSSTVFAGTVQTNAQGLITFAALGVPATLLQTAASYTAVFTNSQVQTGGTLSLPLTVMPAAPVALRFRAPFPTTGTTGTALSPTVTVAIVDQYGNLTTATDLVSVVNTPGTGAAGASVLGTTSLSAVNGVASFLDLAIDKPGTGYTLTATATSRTSAVSPAFDVVLGPATRYLVTAPTTTPTAGQLVTVTAALIDKVSNPVPTPSPRTVNWTLSGGGSLSGASSTTDAQGRATIVFTEPTTSSTNGLVTATDAQTPSITGSITFVAPVIAGPPSNMTAFTPTTITTPVGTPVSTANYPAVRITDNSGNPVSNSQLDLTISGAPCNSLNATSATVFTDANGVGRLPASVPFSAGSVGSAGGSCSINIGSSPLDASIRFVMIAVPALNTWLGKSSTWSDGSNWSSGAAPVGPTDVIFIPAFAQRNATVPGTSLTLGGLVMEPSFGPFFDVGNAALTINGDYTSGPGSEIFSSGQGTIVFNKTGASTLAGFVFAPSTIGNAAGGSSYKLSNVLITRDVTINSPLDLDTLAMSVSGTATIQAFGKLIMTKPNAAFVTSGDATFQGADETNAMTAGGISIGGNLRVNFNNLQEIGRTFAPTAGQILQMIGSGAYSITFGSSVTPAIGNLTVGPTTSLTINDGSGFNGVNLSGNLLQAGTLTIPSSLSLGVTGTAGFITNSITNVAGTLTLSGTTTFSQGSTVTGAGTLNLNGACFKSPNANVSVTHTTGSTCTATSP